VPGLRDLPKRMVEDFEVYFMKEQVTQGYQINKVDENGDYIYFIYRGVCKLLYPTNKMSDIFVKSDLFDPDKQQLVMIGHISRGDMFGEQSALNDISSTYTVAACSPKVEYYKIHRSDFLKYFGGDDGNQVNEMRARMIQQNNWFHSKLLMIETMGIQNTINLEFCNP